MALYGILKGDTNTGLASELLAVFTAPLSVKSNQPAYVQDSVNLRRYAASQNVQRWEVTANIQASSGDASYLMHSVIHGHNGVFKIRMPQVALLKTNTGSLQTDSSTYAAGTNVINTTGITVTPGEFISINNKVYLTTAVSGGLLTISPGLVAPVSPNTVVRSGDSVTMFARYDTDTHIGIVYADGVLMDPGSLRFIEDLP